MVARALQPHPRPAAPSPDERVCPRWALRATAALADAGARVRVIAANTPLNLRRELDRLEQAWRTGGTLTPSFTYDDPTDHGALRAVLEAIADALAKHGELGEIYAARARELADDAALCETAGTPALWGAARRRFAQRDRFDADADATADTWLAERPGDAPPDPDGADREQAVRSDDELSPASLVSRLRQEIGQRRLPLRVVVKDNLASLAATGDGFVQVVKGRRLSRRDVERTVLHEIEGHVEPRVVASSARLGIFVVGTARGADDQEGRALCLERAAGFLDRGRRHEIALRHLAARSVEAQADFVATARLLQDRGAALDVALRIAARAHRGGGLGREAVYLPALLRVEAAVAADGALDRVLAAGRVAVDAAPALRAWVD
jgi:Domain of unknown function (DUF1704)